MEEIRKMVTALRSLSLDGTPQVIECLREIQNKATKLGDFTRGNTPEARIWHQDLAPPPVGMS